MRAPPLFQRERRVNPPAGSELTEGPLDDGYTTPGPHRHHGHSRSAEVAEAAEGGSAEAAETAEGRSAEAAETS